MHDQYRKNLYTTGIKLLHFLTSVALFWIFWMLFRYGNLSPEKDVGFRYNHIVTLAYAIGLFFSTGHIILIS